MDVVEVGEVGLFRDDRMLFMERLGLVGVWEVAVVDNMEGLEDAGRGESMTVDWTGRSLVLANGPGC